MACLCCAALLELHPVHSAIGRAGLLHPLADMGRQWVLSASGSSRQAIAVACSDLLECTNLSGVLTVRKGPMARIWRLDSSATQ